MPEITTITMATLALGAGAAVSWMLARAQRRRARERAGYLAACSALFDQPVVAIQPSGFPRLSGCHEGHAFDIQIVPDTLSVRKLPALWVLVSLPETLPTYDTVDLMMRPSGHETFSNFSRLPVQVQAPHGFPLDCAIRTDAAGPVPWSDNLRDVLGAVDERRLKEVLVAPKGVRIVFLAEEAPRTRYLLYRDAEVGRSPLSPAMLAPFLAAATSLRDAVVQDMTDRRIA